MIARIVSVVLLFLVCGVLNAQGPENTLVVVNEESQDSLAVANLYIDLRDIPATNVVYLSGIRTSAKFGPESSSSKAFRSQILDPILKAMKERGIENQIDCIAYSAGFPTRINFQPEMNRYLKRAGKKYSIQLHAPWASITSLTYFHLNAFSGSPNFLELDANRYSAIRPTKITANPFSGDDAATYSAALKSATGGDYEAASKSLLELARKHPLQMAVVYSLARVFAVEGKHEKAILALRHAMENGFSLRSALVKDKAFEKLRSRDEFKELVNQMEDLPAGVLGTRAFSGSHYWAKNGWPNGTSDQGERYILSSVLAVTGVNQSSLSDSLARLRSSVKADGSAPEGMVYFADHKDPRSRTRSRQFPFAAQELETLGREVVVGKDIYPKNNKAVIGVTLGSPVLDWKKSKSRFLPGAICDNFTSYGGWWEKKGQTQLSEFLDAGAAGACGTVYEPYTIPAKIPNARWHAHYARGATLAESFYQSVSGPFQLLLVGDPLCCPFGRFPDFEIKGLADGETVTGDFVLRVDPSPNSPEVERYEIFYDGVFLDVVPNPDQIAVATDTMSDGRHELRIVAISDSPIPKKRSKKLGIVLDDKDHRVTLKIEDSLCQLGGEIIGKVTSSFSDSQIEVRHNMRKLATVKSGGTFRIPCGQVGLGRSKLQAVVIRDQQQVVRSSEVLVEVRN